MDLIAFHSCARLSPLTDRSGHQASFYQPQAVYSIFERAIGAKDIATGKRDVTRGSGLRTSGPSNSSIAYRQGDKSVENEPLSSDATYNITTGRPN